MLTFEINPKAPPIGRCHACGAYIIYSRTPALTFIEGQPHLFCEWCNEELWFDDEPPRIHWPEGHA